MLFSMPVCSNSVPPTFVRKGSVGGKNNNASY